LFCRATRNWISFGWLNCQWIERIYGCVSSNGLYPHNFVVIRYNDDLPIYLLVFTNQKSKAPMIENQWFALCPIGRCLLAKTPRPATKTDRNLTLMPGWWFQPPWKILVRLDHWTIIPTIGENNPNVPNHQTDTVAETHYWCWNTKMTVTASNLKLLFCLSVAKISTI
jgi:hypothetical protein